jgi:hypothetical protein
MARMRIVGRQFSRSQGTVKERRGFADDIFYGAIRMHIASLMVLSVKIT